MASCTGKSCANFNRRPPVHKKPPHNGTANMGVADKGIAVSTTSRGSTPLASSGLLKPIIEKVRPCFSDIDDLMNLVQGGMDDAQKNMREKGVKPLDYLLQSAVKDRLKKATSIITKINISTVKCLVGDKFMCPPPSILALLNKGDEIDKIQQIVANYSPILKDLLQWISGVLETYAGECPASDLAPVIARYKKLQKFVDGLVNLTQGMENFTAYGSCYSEPTVTVPAWTLQLASILIVVGGLYVLHRYQ